MIYTKQKGCFMETIKLDIHNMEFAEQVKYARMVLQLSQTDLARQIGVSYPLDGE